MQGMKSEKQESRMLQQESKGGRGRVCKERETKGKDQRESQREMPEGDARERDVRARARARARARNRKEKGRVELKAIPPTRKPMKHLYE